MITENAAQRVTLHQDLRASYAKARQPIWQSAADNMTNIPLFGGIYEQITQTQSH